MVLSGRPSIMGSNSLTFNACFLGPTTIGAAESWRTGGTSMVSLVCSLALRGGSGAIPLSSPNVTKCITRTKISMSLGGCTTITQRSVGKPSCRDREMSVSRYQISLWQIRRFSFRPGLCEAASNSPAVAQLEQESVPLKASGEDQATEFQKIRQYPFPEIEAKWQSLWEEQKTFCTPDAVDTSKPKFYALDMFPYPSGAGLHVGHPEGYTATDIIARYKRMRGFNVLHPIGWDAFGLPAEQYAIQTGTHPRETTLKNIDRFRCQLKSLGFSYDWQREISTAEPDYYKWTQWIFLQLFNRGLAYQAEVPVNWCPALATVLANEEVIDGLSERGGYPVIRKPMMQWVLRITAYADRLLEDLDELDWPESIKEMQRNWIGRSEGAEINFEIVGDAGSESSMTLRVFTTRPDTICGATYLVIAPEHPLLHDLVSKQQKTAVDQYVEAAKRKSDLERTELQKKKSGIFTGTSATNPATGEAIPVWVADYVLGSYGTGAIMAVPAHDSRDYEFAKSFNLPMRVVICSGKDLESHDEVYSGDGTMINSSHTSVGVHLDGLPNTEAASTVTEWLQQRGQGNKQVNYKLRDWLFARQRYWGEPFPIIFVDGASTPRAVSESGLPIRLPNIEDFTPAENGEPPLAKAASWVNTIDEETGKRARRETNTMPQWAGSCWYYLRFMDPKNSKQLVSPEKERYWGPVDLYVGGAEHSVLHLLYARFWHKVLFDIGVVSTKEPFQCLVNQGMILGQIEYTTYQRADGVYISADEADEDCEPQRVSENEVMKSGDSYILKSDESVRVSARAHKMSKSRGNVINPEDVIRDFGADSLRLYEMFMGPLRDTKVWSTSGVEGVYRFLGRSWRVFVGVPLQGESCPTGSSLVTDSTPSDEQLKAIHRCIQKVTDDIEGLRFNTAISSMMEFINAAIKWNSRPRSVLEPFILLLAPFAPHVAEELWHRVGHSKSLAYEPWPEANSLYLKDESVILPVQINGKMRGKVQVPADADEETARAVVIKSGDFDKFLDGKSIKKTIFVSGRILNFVVK